MSDQHVEPGSFRDRHGRVFYRDERVLRCLSESAAENFRLLSEKPFYGKAVDAGKLVGSREAELADAPPGDWAMVLEHDRIPLISYPYEWSFSMLQDAALLQLELTEKAVAADLMLKDASAYNLQWRGVQPVFIDVPSFEPLPAGGVWTGYRQFCQMFSFPLMLQAYRNLPFQPLMRGLIDGIPPELANGLFSVRDRLRKGVFTHAYLQSKLQDRYAGSDRDVRRDVRSAGFSKEMIRANLKGMRKLVSGLSWAPGTTEWSDYLDFHNYSEQDHQRKAEFVETAVRHRPRRQVWDLGANTGQFSRIAAAHADYVLAADIDALAVERNYRALKKEGIGNILPLVLNLADPSPALGWRLSERKPLPERGQPDLVLCLALIHHLVITANLPMAEVIDWLASLGGELVIEFVSKSDDKVQTLLRNKDDQYHEYELDHFEQLLGRAFRIEQRLDLESGNRHLFHAVQPK